MEMDCRQNQVCSSGNGLQSNSDLLLWKWTAARLRFKVMEMDCRQRQVCSYGIGLQSDSGLVIKVCFHSNHRYFKDIYILLLTKCNEEKQE